MPVRLDKIAPVAPTPKAPRIWYWLLLLGLVLTTGGLLALFSADDPAIVQADRFWLDSLVFPFLVWCGLGFVRALLYVGELSVADGWNEARETDMIQHIRRGRRSQQVLAVSLHTALRERGAENGEPQRDALLNGQKALISQPDWQASEEGLRHSRLPHEPGEPAIMLLRLALVQVLRDIGAELKKLPHRTPLALLLDMHSSISEESLAELWQDVWAKSGIQQTATSIDGHGVAVVDSWLDQRIQDQALLLVVAFQVAPADAQNTAEAVVGLLLANRLTQTTLEPIAYLHRPEQERAAEPDGLLRATRQALDWVPLDAASVYHVWIASGHASRALAINEVLSESRMLTEHRTGLHDLGSLLGNAGCAAPWVAIAGAVESIRAEGQPHFIFSGEAMPDAGLWCSVVAPNAAIRKSDE